jgi:hypothetical protein
MTEILDLEQKLGEEEKTRANLVKERTRRSGEIKRLDEKNAKENGAKGVNVFTKLEIELLNDTETKIDGSNERSQQILSAIADAKKRQAVAADEARAATQQQVEARLGLAQEREHAGRSASAHLAMMGQDGRLRGQIALQMLNDYGMDTLPADLIAEARSYAPESVTNMAEREGRKYLGEARRLAPNETGFKYDIKETANEVDALKKQLAELEKDRAIQFKNAMLEVMQKSDKQIIEAMMQALDDRLARLQNDMQRAEIQR